MAARGERHAFRRLWATERKAFPVKDVAAAGGWKDISTLIDCYQQPDDDTLRARRGFREAGTEGFDDEAQGVRSRK